MAKSKRKLQEVTTHSHTAGYWKAAIEDASLSALLLDMELSLSNAKRINLNLVRFNRMRREHADLLISLLREFIDTTEGVDYGRK